MNNGLGFFVFGLLPLFGLWTVGAAVGAMFLGIMHRYTRRRPDWRLFLQGGGIATSVSIGAGMNALRFGQGHLDDMMTTCFGFAVISALSWVVLAFVAVIRRPGPLGALGFAGRLGIAASVVLWLVYCLAAVAS
jgi:hypothetical protein